MLDQQFFDTFGDLEGADLAIDQAMIDDWFTQSCRAIVNRVQLYNPTMLWAFASDSVVNDGTGLAIGTIKSAHVLHVKRLKDSTSKTYPCYPIIGALLSQTENEDSPHYAYDIDPRYGFESGKLYIKPDPDADDDGTISYVKLPTIVDTSGYATLNDVDSNTFPVDLDHTAVLYAVIQGKIRSLHYFRGLSVDQMTSIAGTVTVSTQAFTSVTQVVVTHNAGTRPMVQIIDSNNKIIDGEVTHTSVNVVTIDFVVAQSGTVLLSLATSSGGQIDSFVAALPTWTSPTVPSMPTPITPGDIEAMVKALPAYTALDFTGVVAPSVLSLPTAITPGNLAAAALTLPTYAAISFTGVDVIAAPTLPTVITPGDVAAPQSAPEPANVDFTGIVSPTLSSALATGFPSIDALTTATLGDISETRVLAALNRASDFIDVQNAAGSADSVTVDTHAFLSDDDVDLANEATKAANAYTQTAQQEIALELAKISGAGEEVRYATGKFSGDVQAYATRVNGAIAEYQAQIADYTADIRKMLGQYESESKSDIDKFSADAQNEVATYKAEIEADIAAYRGNVEAVVGKYNIDVQNYTAEVRKTIETYAQEEKLQIDLFMAEFNEREKQYLAETQMDIAAYKAEADTMIANFSASVNRYTAMVQKTIQEYNDENKLQIDLFMAELDERIRQYQAETTADINAYQAESQAVLGEYNALVAEMSQEFQSGMAKAISYLEAAKIRLQIVAQYNQMSQLIPNEIVLLQRQFDDEVRAFCGVQQIQGKQDEDEQQQEEVL